MNLLHFLLLSLVLPLLQSIFSLKDFLHKKSYHRKCVMSSRRQVNTKKRSSHRIFSIQQQQQQQRRTEKKEPHCTIKFMRSQGKKDLTWHSSMYIFPTFRSICHICIQQQISCVIFFLCPANQRIDGGTKIRRRCTCNRCHAFTPIIKPASIPYETNIYKYFYTEPWLLDSHKGATVLVWIPRV